MERVSQRHVELVLIGCAEHDAKVITVGPVSFGPDLFLDAVVEDGSGEGIGKRDSDVVGARVADEGYRLLDVFPGLSGVAELQEVACADAFIREARASSDNIGDVKTFIHRVEDVLRTGFHTHPYLRATRAFKSGYGGVSHQIGAGLNFEGQNAMHCFDLIRELLDPAAVECEDIIAEPDVLHAIHFFQFAYLGRDASSRANLKLIP